VHSGPGPCMFRACTDNDNGGLVPIFSFASTWRDAGLDRLQVTGARITRASGNASLACQSMPPAADLYNLFGGAVKHLCLASTGCAYSSQRQSVPFTF
jgi:hypothetical protein